MSEQEPVYYVSEKLLNAVNLFPEQFAAQNSLAIEESCVFIVECKKIAERAVTEFRKSQAARNYFTEAVQAKDPALPSARVRLAKEYIEMACMDVYNNVYNDAIKSKLSDLCKQQARH